MTTLNEAREAIYLRFTTNFTGLPASRYSFENEEFAEPDGGSWVRLTVRSIHRGQNTMGGTGNRRFRTTGIVFAQVFVEANSGVQTSDNLLKEISDIYDGVSFSGLDFFGAFSKNMDADGKWKNSIVEAKFDFDEIK